MKQLLSEKGITQKQLSEKTGIPTSSIASWFGKQSSYPSIEYASIIADELGCSIDYLIGREDESGLITIKNEHEKSELEKINEQLDSVHKAILLGYATALLQEQRRLA